MASVTIDEAEIACLVDGSGPGLVLIHGTGGNANSNWDQVVKRFSPHRTVVRPNYSGSGETTDSGSALGVEQLAAQVVAAAKAAGAVPFDLIGFSLGAGIATFIAAKYPELVRSVVLLAGFLSGEDSRLKLQFELWRDLIDSDRRALARLILLTGFSPDFLAGLSETNIDQSVDEIVRNNNWEGMRRQVDLDMTIDVRVQAQRIAKSVLVIAATQAWWERMCCSRL
jgi:3-oxoadipate enol-lactonase